ncbi:MAG: hypothetical protein RMJ49_08485, partial [Bacteroidia bacterium]|nr:hypothetical protein [Bacteroidia bacterium]
MWPSPLTRIKVSRWLFGIGGVWAQTLSVDTLIPPGVGHLPLPPGWLLQETIEFTPSVAWRYDSSTHQLLWPAVSETLRLRYKYYVLPAASPRFQPLPLKALEKWDSLRAASQFFVPPITSTSSDSFVPSLQRSGSLIRTLTIGTGQNATFNSAFRLQLEGQIAPDLFLLAALTDENLPFQTAATQTLADFDRVYIGLRWRKIQLFLGDLELRQSGTTFANFYRNVLGLEARLPWKDQQTRLAFAEAKGRFHTNSFLGQEGRQGPYPLTGKNGERFITILAGSERVYVNGLLMQRGQDKDYIMDYAVGEITFTPRVPITAATRIVVDFEYADRSYGRTFLWAEQKGSLGPLTYTCAYFRQADNPRRPLDFSLTPAEEAYLASLPPGQSVGILSGIDTLPYESGSIRYERRDTLLNGQLISFFQVSQDPERALYQLSFFYVGAGRGDYIRERSTLNGNVFRWVGEGRGDYRIGRVIPLPTSVEVLSLRHTWQLTPGLSWESELDGSRFSENRFAGHVKTDLATRQKLRWRLGSDTLTWTFAPEVAFQYVGAAYQNADRVYEREYGRLWNFNDLGRRAIERLIEAKLPLTWKRRYRLTPHIGWRSWGDSLQNQRYAVLWEGTDTTRGLGGQYLLEYLPASTSISQDRWFRQTGRIFYTLGRWQFGSAVWTERRRTKPADSATFRFQEYTPFLRYHGLGFTFYLSYQWRQEWQYLASELAPAEKLRFVAHMPQMEIALTREAVAFRTSLAYRLFQPGDTGFRLEAKRLILSQNTLRLRLRPWEVEGFYQVSAEQTPQRQILFVSVNPGQGTHEWRDLNGDGLQQLEEFFPAVNPLLANFIRVQRATGRFIPTIAVGAALTLRWQPTRRLRWLSYQSNTRLDQRQSAPDSRWYRYLPAPPPTDSTFLQWTLLHRQELFLFRTAARGDQTFSFQYQLSQLFPLSGLQRQQTVQVLARTRYNFTQAFGAEVALTHLRRLSYGLQQPELNYRYHGWEVYPQVVYQPSGRWRTAIGLLMRWRWIEVPASPRLWGMRLPLEQRWSLRAGALFSLRVEPAFFQGPPLPPLLGIDLLEGFQLGRSAFLGLTLSYPIGRFIELSLLYEGRFSQVVPIHSA